MILTISVGSNVAETETAEWTATQGQIWDTVPSFHGRQWLDADRRSQVARWPPELASPGMPATLLLSAIQDQ